MKKYILLSSIIFSALVGKTQMKFYVQSGLITTYNHVPNHLNGGQKYKRYSSFDAGVSFKTHLYKKLHSESGIFYNQKGYQFYNDTIPDFEVSGYFHVNYLTLNQNFVLLLYKKKNMHLFTGAGAFLANAISGKYVRDVIGIGGLMHEEGKINIGYGSTDQFRPWDTGLNFLLRLGYRKMDITAMSSPSLTSHVTKASQQNNKEKLQSLSFNLGYNF
ncbi:MAG: hypothetical protein H0W12_02915 [Chitinophagaceae bacterium]|nr:hypothetical protein [Chitinophagaceae bacterium]